MRGSAYGSEHFGFTAGGMETLNSLPNPGGERKVGYLEEMISPLVSTTVLPSDRGGSATNLGEMSDQ